MLFNARTLNMHKAAFMLLMLMPTHKTKNGYFLIIYNTAKDFKYFIQFNKL